MDIKPTAYFLDELNSAGELIDREYNGINQFSGGRGNGMPLYTQQQLEAAIAATLEKAAKVCEEVVIENGGKTARNKTSFECAAAIRSMK